MAVSPRSIVVWLLAVALLVSGLWVALRLHGAKAAGTPMPSLRPPAEIVNAIEGDRTDRWYKDVLEALGEDARAWNADPARARERKQAWLETLLGLIMSSDRSEIPFGLYHIASSMASELGDADALQAIALAGAEGLSGAEDRLVMASLYLQSVMEDTPPTTKEGWRKFADQARGFAAEAIAGLRETASMRSFDDRFTAMANSVSYKASELLAKSDEVREAAQLEEQLADVLNEFPAQGVVSTPSASLPDEAYQRAARRWLVSAKDSKQAMEVLSKIESASTRWKDAAWHASLVVSDGYFLNRGAAAEAARNLAIEWLEVHPQWESTSDVRLVHALVLDLAHTGVAADAQRAMDLGERLLNESSVFEDADRQAISQAQPASGFPASMSSLRAGLLQSLSDAARVLRDRQTSDRYWQEFVAEYPDHPSATARAASRK
jgi:hypothetical protein